MDQQLKEPLNTYNLNESQRHYYTERHQTQKFIHFCTIPFMTLLKRPRYSEGKEGMIFKGIAQGSFWGDRAVLFSDYGGDYQIL